MNLLVGLYKAGMGKPWKALGIRDDLSQIGKLIEGRMEITDLPYHAVLITNDASIINSMHYNTTIGGLQVFGPCLILGRKGEEFCDAPEEYVLLLEGQTNDKRKQK